MGRSFSFGRRDFLCSLSHLSTSYPGTSSFWWENQGGTPRSVFFSGVRRQALSPLTRLMLALRAAMCEGLPWTLSLSRPGTGLRIWIPFWQGLGKRKKEELRRKTQGENQLRGIHTFCFGARIWRLCYLIPLGLAISKLLQANRNHSHSLWPSRKEADLFPSQPLGFSALTIGKLWWCQGLIKQLAFKICYLPKASNSETLGEALGLLIRKELHCGNTVLSFFSPEKPMVSGLIHTVALVAYARGLCHEIWESIQ